MRTLGSDIILISQIYRISWTLASVFSLKFNEGKSLIKGYHFRADTTVELLHQPKHIQRSLSHGTHMTIRQHNFAVVEVKASGMFIVGIRHDLIGRAERLMRCGG